MRAALAGGLCFWAATVPVTQAQGHALADSALLVALARTDSLAIVRIDGAAETRRFRLEGRLLAVGADSLRIRSLLPPHEVSAMALGDTQALYRKRGSHALRGALIGGGATAAVIALLAGVGCWDTGIDVSPCQRDGAVAGAVVGGVVGFLVGASYARWQLVYAR